MYSRSGVTMQTPTEQKNSTKSYSIRLDNVTRDILERYNVTILDEDCEDDSETYHTASKIDMRSFDTKNLIDFMHDLKSEGASRYFLTYVSANLVDCDPSNVMLVDPDYYHKSMLDAALNAEVFSIIKECNENHFREAVNDKLNTLSYDAIMMHLRTASFPPYMLNSQYSLASRLLAMPEFTVDDFNEITEIYESPYYVRMLIEFWKITSDKKTIRIKSNVYKIVLSHLLNDLDDDDLDDVEVYAQIFLSAPIQLQVSLLFKVTNKLFSDVEEKIQKLNELVQSKLDLDPEIHQHVLSVLSGQHLHKRAV